jgi:hypothetical protein
VFKLAVDIVDALYGVPHHPPELSPEALGQRKDKLDLVADKIDKSFDAQQPVVDVDALATALEKRLCDYTCSEYTCSSRKTPLYLDPTTKDAASCAGERELISKARAHLAPAPSVVGKMGIVVEMDIGLAIQSGALKLCPTCEDATCTKHAPEVQEAVQDAHRQAQGAE